MVWSTEDDGMIPCPRCEGEGVEESKWDRKLNDEGVK